MFEAVVLACLMGQPTMCVEAQDALGRIKQKLNV